MAVTMLSSRSCHSGRDDSLHRFPANFVACWRHAHQRGRPGLRRRRPLRARRAARGVGLRPLRRGPAGPRLRGLRAGRASGADPGRLRHAPSSTTSAGPRRPTWSPCPRDGGRAGAARAACSRRCGPAHERGARIMSLCTGAFVLGEAGLLDGRSCTTHWRHTDELAARFPLARVVPEVLYVDDDRVLTSAGTAAGHRRLPAPVARRSSAPRPRAPWPGGWSSRRSARAARRSTSAPRSPTATPRPSARCWSGSTEHLDEQHTVESLAQAASMSPRTFARRFRAETGTTPHAWITSQRVLRAEELLETTDRSVDWIAGEVGFGTAAMLRHHFTRARVGQPAAVPPHVQPSARDPSRPARPAGLPDDHPPARRRPPRSVDGRPAAR